MNVQKDSCHPPMASLVVDYAETSTTLRGQSAPVVVSGRVRYLSKDMAEDDFSIPIVECIGNDHSLRVVPATDDPTRGDPRMFVVAELGRHGGGLEDGWRVR